MCWHVLLLNYLVELDGWLFCLGRTYHGSLHHYNDVIMGAIASEITSLTIVYSIVYWDTDQRKHQNSASLAFVWIPRINGQLRGKCFHLMTSSWSQLLCVWQENTHRLAWLDCIVIRRWPCWLIIWTLLEPYMVLYGFVRMLLDKSIPLSLTGEMCLSLNGRCFTIAKKSIHDPLNWFNIGDERIIRTVLFKFKTSFLFPRLELVRALILNAKCWTQVRGWIERHRCIFPIGIHWKQNYLTPCANGLVLPCWLAWIHLDHRYRNYNPISQRTAVQDLCHSR